MMLRLRRSVNAKSFLIEFSCIVAVCRQEKRIKKIATKVKDIAGCIIALSTSVGVWIQPVAWRSTMQNLSQKLQETSTKVLRYVVAVV